jgi:hypothetical protein
MSNVRFVDSIRAHRPFLGRSNSLRVLMAGILLTLLVSFGAGIAHADAPTASPSPTTPNTAVSISVDETLGNGQSLALTFVVEAPDGSVYVDQGVAMSNGPSFPGDGTCSIPFGASGSTSSTSSSSHFTVTGCDGPNSAAWALVTGASYSTFVNQCPSSPAFTTGTPGVGSTAQSGVYNVLVCVSNAVSGNGPTMTTFTIQAPSTSSTTSTATGVPQFPIPGVSSIFLAALLLAVIALMARARKSNAPAVSI